MPAWKSSIFIACLTAITCSADPALVMVNIDTDEPASVLPLYRQLSGLQPVLSAQVQELRFRIQIKSEGGLSKTDAAKLLETSLLAQAGIVITPLDAHRASVTWNGQLPSSSSVAPEPIKLIQKFYQIDDQIVAGMRRAVGLLDSEMNDGLVVTKFLRENIDLTPPRSCFYSDSRRDVHLRLTVADIDKIETLVPALKGHSAGTK